MRRSLVLVAAVLLAVLPQAPAQSVDDQYVQVYNLIQEADSLAEKSQSAQALAKYRDAQASLQKIQNVNPTWNAQVVSFRLNYLATRVQELSQQVPAASTNAPAESRAQPGVPPPPADWQNQIAALREQVRDLQSENSTLQSKLKEALAAEPASLDPALLDKAEARIKNLQKENDLLNVRLAEEKSRTAPAMEAAALAEAQQSLADANRKLDEQTKRANSLAQDKQFLESKLSGLAPTAANVAILAATKKSLDEANISLASETKLASQLTKERDNLQVRIKSLSGDSATVKALRAENETLKKQVAQARAVAPKAASEQQLAEARAQVAALQSDKELLRLQNIALRQQLTDRPVASGAPAAAVSATVAADAAATSNPDDVARIKTLEQERDSLQTKLDAAIKSASGHDNKTASARVDALESQVASLRAELDVLEARQVPYTPEELALFQPPAAKLEQTQPAVQMTAQAAARPAQPPKATVALIADAQRHFMHNEMEQAENDYLQALRQDGNNVYMLANVARIEIERNHLEDAEKHVQQALAADPNDAFSLLTLGQLRFRQERYQDALDVLSRAAKLDPQNPETENYLGITLNQLGMRGPAETALRKAIEMDPTYGGAHHNLAVIYITQKPPLVELARWHYQKALALGHPRNPELEKLFVVHPPVD